jgi:hypothetical protein
VGLVCALLKDPERLRAGLEELIESERAGTRGDPDREANSWLENLSEIEQERRGYLRLAAKGHMSDDDLAEALAELDETRSIAESELKAIRGREAALEELERDRDALLESYAGMMPEALDSLAPEERCQVYGMLRLNVDVFADGAMQAQGVLGVVPPVCENGLASGCAASRNRTFDLVYQSLHFGEVIPGGSYYQLVETEFLHLDGELRQSGCRLGRSVQAQDAAERLVESPEFPAKVLECLEQLGEFFRIELSSLEGKPAIAAERSPL